jgi:proteasome assembly chaperone (PAC2) family protein
VVVRQISFGGGKQNGSESLFFEEEEKGGGFCGTSGLSRSFGADMPLLGTSFL